MNLFRCAQAPTLKMPNRCEATTAISASASVVFNQGETAAYFAGEREPDPDATHLGLKLENQASGQAGYILVSLQTGLITSGLLP